MDNKIQEYDGYALSERKEYSPEQLEILSKISKERVKRILQSNKKEHKHER